MGNCGNKPKKHFLPDSTETTTAQGLPLYSHTHTHKSLTCKWQELQNKKKWKKCQQMVEPRNGFKVLAIPSGALEYVKNLKKGFKSHAKLIV